MPRKKVTLEEAQAQSPDIMVSERTDSSKDWEEVADKFDDISDRLDSMNPLGFLNNED
jgi:hypothetical protein